MHHLEFKVYGFILLFITGVLLVAAIWLSIVLLKEAEAIRRSSRNVQTAYGFVNIQIGKKLKENTAIHFLDLVQIVDRTSLFMPSVKVCMDKDLERSQINIIMESGEIKATYTLLATIVEYPHTPKLA